MSGEEDQDDRIDEARRELKRAIDAYYDVVAPGSYIDDWVLVVHRQTMALERSHRTTVTLTIPPDQPLYRSVGLLVQAGAICDDIADTTEIEDEDD